MKNLILSVLIAFSSTSIANASTEIPNTHVSRDSTSSSIIKNFIGKLEMPITGREDEWAFSYIRLTYEPVLGGTFIQNGYNEIDPSIFSLVTGIGLETNLLGKWASLQVSLIGPSDLIYKKDSPILDRLPEGVNSLRANVGGAIGLSLFNGVLGLGVGGFYIDDSKVLKEFRGKFSDKRDGFAYIRFQPVTFLTNHFFRK